MFKRYLAAHRTLVLGAALLFELGVAALALYSLFFESHGDVALATTVFVGTVFHSLKKTLDNIVDDRLDGYQDRLLMPKYFDESEMEDAYVDDLEMAGPGLASRKTDGAQIPMGTIREGVLTRYMAYTFGLGIAVTEEAMEDRKYPQVIDAARRLKRALYKTVDYDAANVLIRAFNTAYVGGDGLPLCSASHTLPNGGTFSNTMATPLSPSRQALVIATTQIRKFPAHDGLFDFFLPKCINCPVDQWEAWAVILGAERAPEPGEFNAPNVFNQDMKLDLYPNQYWSNTTTNWIVGTDVENGLSWKWRRKPRSKTWVNNEQDILMYSITARWARLWSDPRCVLGSQA